MASPRTTTAPSVTSSAGTTKSASLPFLPRYTPKPEPAYVSHAAAADHVLHNRDDDLFDQRSPTASPTNEPVNVSDRSLSLLNSFLDSLLYNFLAKARGTSLNQLRPAISEVLKPKLARDALANADEELEGLVGEAGVEGEDDGDHDAWSQDWHLEMAFKRMRLRVMVFIRLGDFDDEDEERFLEQEEDLRNGESTLQEEALLASPAAVYLASVLEYIAENCLSIAGDAAYKRISGRTHRRVPSDEEDFDPLSPSPMVLQESDLEKITLNPTLGRLWRTWRKNYRTMFATSGGTLTPRSPGAGDLTFRGRLGSLNETVAAARRSMDHDPEDRKLSPDEIPDGDVSEHDIAANIPLPMAENDVEEIETIEMPEQEIVAGIPLPMGDNDINEIEVPGLAKEISDDAEEEVAVPANEETTTRRPLSVILSWLTPFSWVEQRPPMKRMRSNSVPTRVPPSFVPLLEPAEPAEEAAQPTEAIGEPLVANDLQPDLSAANDEAILNESPVPAEKVVEEPEMSPVNQNHTVEPSIAEKEMVEDAPIAEKEEAIASPVESKASKEDHNNNKGIFAGALAGATALVGSAVAVVAGTSHKDEIEAKEPSPISQMPKGMPSEHSLDAEAEKPKSTVSSTIADRRRMFELQNQAAQKGTSPISSSPVMRGTSPAPSEEKKVEEQRDLAVQPPTRSSSLDTKAAAAAAVSAAAAASFSPVSLLKTETSSQSYTPPTDSQTTGQHARPQSYQDDQEAIGLAKTSDVPIHQARSVQSASPPPSEARSYHLPGTQSPKSFQGRSENGNTNPPIKLANRDVGLVGADTLLLTRNGSGSQSSLSSNRASTKAEEKSSQNAEHDIPHAVPFYHSQADEGTMAKVEKVTQRTSSTTKPRPPPLTTTMNEDLEGTEYLIRPTSSAARSASSTPGGHSTKGSASSSMMQRQIDKKSLEESRQRDFDSLLKNNEPVKYTLTPEDLRTTENRSTIVNNRASALADRGPPSPRIISSSVMPKRSSPPREAPRETVPVPRRETPSPNGRSASPKRKAGIPRVSQYRRSAAFRSLNAKPEPMNTNMRRSGFMPREPRVITDDTNDLADYMRTTRPTAEPAVIPLVRTASNPKLNDRTSIAIPRSASRQRLVARDPEVKEDGTSDLIDFIRQGPPGSKLPGEKEQRRTVAPFRTTMDSDDLASLGDFSNIGKTSGANAMGPNSGLLKNGSTVHKAGLPVKTAPPTRTAPPVKASSQTRSSSANGGNPPIVRKQRRVKDPYAIDSDDDDDDFLGPLPAGGGRAVQAPQEEESLADFLRNSEPPSMNDPKPLNVSSPRTNSMNGSSVGRPVSRSVNSGFGSSVAQNNPRAAMFAINGPSNGAMRTRFEARAAGATRNGFGGNGFYYSTNDMADFLRSSGPVDNMAPRTVNPSLPSPSVPPIQKKPSKRVKVFNL